MTRRSWHLVAACASSAFLCVPAHGGATGQSGSCESLDRLALPHTLITQAQSVAAGEFRLPQRVDGPAAQTGRANDVAFCRVAATLTPSTDSHIQMEVWLPLSGWNRKFLAAGNGGWAGRMAYNGMLPALQQGYATASTDTGHDASMPG
jgi:feruloyl esterase